MSNPAGRSAPRGAPGPDLLSELIRERFGDPDSAESERFARPRRLRGTRRATDTGQQTHEGTRTDA